MIQCCFENGNKAEKGLRHVTVGSIAINEKNEVLLVKRAANIHNGGKYTLPGGFLDRNENTSDGALRELREETGFDGEIVSLFRVNDNPNRPKEDRQNVDFIYLVRVVGGASTLNSEVSDIHWFGRDTLPPDEEFAFDHRDSIIKSFEYLEKEFPLPLRG